MVAEGESAPNVALNLIKHALHPSKAKYSSFLNLFIHAGERSVVDLDGCNFTNLSLKVFHLGSCGCDNVAAGATHANRAT